MTAKAPSKKEELCMEKEEAINIAEMTESLIRAMTGQSKRLKERGYETTDIDRRIKDAKARLKATKRRLKG